MSLFIGPAGWSYRDWEGIVYPPGSYDRLSYLIEYFDLIEINSSFYHPPRASISERWAELASRKSGFRFTAKIHQSLTHGDLSEVAPADLDRIRNGMKPLVEKDVLGAVLCQFPWFFKAEKQNVKRLQAIREWFSDWPLILEVRHRSWLRPDALRMVKLLRYSLATIDQPESKEGLAMKVEPVGDVGYLRLHGRNSEAWFDRKAGRDDKYNYLYSNAELAVVDEVISNLTSRYSDVYVVTNNHFEGQAVLNALELVQATGGAPKFPPGLVERYRSPKEEADRPPGEPGSE